MNELIKIKNLTKNFSNFVALDNLNLSIEENTCVGFLGPNGAGKSTTIKILTGLIRPNSGNAIILGKDVQHDIHNALSDIGVLVEIPQFYSNLTPYELLSYFGKLRGMQKNNLENRISEVLEHVNLSEWTQKKIRTFSKGMKQRLGIACALLHNPTILILDEPSSGLDPRGMIEVRQIIKELKKQGKTIFMSSHLLSEVQEVCDAVAIIDKGKLLRYESDLSDLESIYMKETSDSVE
jgi:ABC-2 type transport system ATP-binding protein